MEERVKTSYDHPSAMDHSLLLEHLQALKRLARQLTCRVRYVEHTRMKETVVEPKGHHSRRHLFMTDAHCVMNLTSPFRWSPAGYLPDAPHQA